MRTREEIEKEFREQAYDPDNRIILEVLLDIRGEVCRATIIKPIDIRFSPFPLDIKFPSEETPKEG